MASSIAYSTLLGLAQPVNGQEAGTWGDDINLGLTNYLDSAIAGTLTISSSSDATLSISNYSTANPNLGSSSSQYMILSCTANLSAVQHINVPQTSKMYLVFNGTTGSSNNINVRGYTGSTYTTGITLVPGERALVAYSLSANDVIKVSSNFLTGLTGTFTSGGVVYANTTSTLTTSSALTQYGVLYGGGAGGAPSATAAGTNNQLLVGTTSAAPSWINPSSVTVGAATTATTATNLSGGSAQAIPYQSSSGTTTFLGATTAGSLLQTNNTGSAPSWVSPGALTVGTATNATNLTGTTQYSVPYQSGSGATAFLSPTTSGYLLQTNSTSSAPSWIAPSNLTVGTATTATTATTANALNASNSYYGYAFTASSSFIGPGTGLTGTATSLSVGFAASSTNSTNSTNATFGPGGGSIVTSYANGTAGSDSGWQSFTPVLSGSNGAVTFTYSANAQQGRYLTIGNMVYVQIYIGWTAASATTDQLVINNLPIAGSALPSGWGNNYNGFGLLQCSHAVSYGLQLFPVVLNGGNKLFFFAPYGTFPLQSSSTANFNAGVNISSTGFVYGCFSYSTS